MNKARSEIEAEVAKWPDWKQVQFWRLWDNVKMNAGGIEHAYKFAYKKTKDMQNPPPALKSERF